MSMRGVTLIEALVYCSLLTVLLTGCVYALWIEYEIAQQAERLTATVQDRIFSEDRDSQVAGIYLP
jgi:hypothetical protein